MALGAGSTFRNFKLRAKVWIRAIRRSDPVTWFLWFNCFNAVFWALHFGFLVDAIPSSKCDFQLGAWWQISVQKILLAASVVAVLFVPRRKSSPDKRFPILINDVYLVILTVNAYMYVAYFKLGITATDTSPVTPLDVLYFTLITFTTVGYGDFQPCPSARIYAAVHGLFGIVCAALIAILLNRGLAHR